MARKTSKLSASIRNAPSLEYLASQRAEFEHAPTIWSNILAPELERREIKRKRVLSKAYRNTAIGAAIPIIAFFIIMFATPFGFAGLFPIFLFGTLLSIAFVSAFDWLKVFTLKSQTKDLVLSAACEPFGFTYETLHPDLSGIRDFKTLAKTSQVLAAQNGSFKKGKDIQTPFGPIHVESYTSGGMPPPTPAYETLKAAKLLPSHASRRFEDLIAGERAGVKFALVEAELKSGGDDNETTFQGILVHIEYPEAFLGRTIMARSGWWKRGKDARDLQKVDLVSRELENAFTVYSTDQVEARALLTPDRMERLIALERHFSGGKLRGIFENGSMTIALEAEDQFEAGSILDPLVDPRRYASALVELGLVCDLIDGFLTRDWVRGRI